MSTTRPLGHLSDFVVEELPLLLADGQWQAIPKRVEKMLKSLVDSLDLVKAYFNNRELSLIDLKFVEAALIRSGTPVPETLTTAVDFFCGSGLNVPGLQYHELVELNPEDDLRIFMTGTPAKWETFFYNSHRLLERRFARMIPVIEEHLAEPENGSRLIQNYQALFDQDLLGRVIDGLIEMPKDDFEKFRHYISQPLPIRNVDGPSGAYSWRVPYMEMLFWGKELPEPYVQKIESNLKYYSLEGRRVMEVALPKLASGICVKDTESAVEFIPEVMESFMRFMELFRNMHLAAVAKLLPKEYKDQAPGTSGESTPGTFLRNRRDVMKNLYESYRKSHKFNK